MTTASEAPPDGERPVGAAHRYIPQLDGLRAIAVAGVIGAHAKVAHAEGGRNGVDVFFVLSGYLITAILLREIVERRGLAFRAFYRRRFARLYPALIPISIVGLVGFSARLPFLTDPIDRELTTAALWGVPAGLTYTTAFVRSFGISGLSYFGHLWSLTVEEVFYLVWPLALVGLMRWRPRHIHITVGLLFGAALLYRFALEALDTPVRWTYNSPDARAYQLLAGAFLAALLHRVTSPKVVSPGRIGGAAGAMGCAMVGVAFVIPESAFGSAFALGVVVTVGAGLLVFHLVTGAGPIVRLLQAPVLRWVGVRSYGIYLWHQVLMGLFDVRGASTITRSALRAGAIALTFVVADLSYRHWEQPWRARLARRREGGALPQRWVQDRS